LFNIAINLQSNRLTEESFDRKSFVFGDSKNRIPLKLNLNNNSFEKFPEEIFRQILLKSENNGILLNGNKFKCDCDMIWLTDNQIRNTVLMEKIECENYNNSDIREINEQILCSKSFSEEIEPNSNTSKTGRSILSHN
jgi:hypothetical protein